MRLKRLALALLLAGCATASVRESITITGPMLRGIDDDGTELIEGDIQPPPAGTRALNVERPYPLGFVFYEIAEDYWATGKVLGAIADWEAAVPGLRFIPRTTQMGGYLRFEVGGGCSSPVGYQGASSIARIKINPSACSRRAVAHEIGHGVCGMWHEQSAQRRDDWIVIHGECIIPGNEHNFNKHGGVITCPPVQGSAPGGVEPARSGAFSLPLRAGCPLDFLSLMLYSSTSWSIDPATCPTMTKRDPVTGEDTGERWGVNSVISPTDALACQNLYRDEIAQRPDCPPPPVCATCPDPEPCPEAPEIPDPPILHDRFEVRCWFVDPADGLEKVCAPAAVDLPDTAVFRFWSHAGWAVYVAMLPPAPFWVGTGGVTDVQYRLEITDTAGGAAWVRPLSSRTFEAPFIDPAAFP